MTTWISHFAAEPWTSLVGALLNTLWEGALVAFILYAVLKFTPAHRSDLRYGAAVGALLAVLIGGFLTWAVLEYEPRSASVETTAAAMPQADSAITALSQMTLPSSAINAASSPKPDPASPVKWHAWVAGLWCVGVALMLIRTMLLVIGAGRLRRRCRPVEDEAIVSLVRQLSAALGLTRRVRVAACDRIHLPAVLGALRATILLPASALTGMPPGYWRAVLAHELAHIRRYDYLVNLGQMFIEALLFFNPAVWWVSRQIRAEREACCDELAAAATGDRIEYARALTEAAATLRAPAFGFQIAQALGGRRPSGSLQDRIRRIIVSGHRPRLRVPWYTMIAALFVSALIIYGLYSGSRATISVAEKILSPRERIEKMNVLRETHASTAGKIADGAAGMIDISGTVKLPDGSPAPDSVPIMLCATRPGYTASHSLNLRDGRFSERVNYGTIHIQAYLPGHAPGFAGPLQTELGGALEGIDIVLQPGFTARLQLVTEQGEPIAGAHLTGQYDRPAGHIPNADWRTDAAGLLALEHASTVPMKLHATSPGYQHDERTIQFAADQAESVKWVLKRANPATGAIVERGTNKPIAGAEIRLLQIQGPQPTGNQPESAETLAVSGENGRFTLNMLRDDSAYFFFVDTPGHERQMLSNIHAGQTGISAMLGPAIVVHGKVVGDIEKLPTRNNRKGVSYDNPYKINDSGYSSTEWAPVEIRDGEAHFEIADLFPTTINITAGPERVRRELTGPVDDLVIDLSGAKKDESTSATRTVVFRLDLPPNAPPAQGKLSATYMKIENGSRMQEQENLEIKDNEVRVEVPVPGEVGYRPDGLTGYWIREIWGIQVPAGEEPFVVGIPAVPAGAIYGRVLEADGSPARAAFIAVVVAKKSPRMTEGSLGVDVKDSTGGDDDRVEKFMAAPLPLGGAYAIVLHRKNTYAVSAPVEVTESKPLNEIELRFMKGVTVEGQALTPEGRPAAGIRFGFDYSTPWSHGFSGGDLFTDANGRFAIDDVNPDAPGKYYLRIGSQNGYRPVNVDVKPNGKPITIRLERGKMVTGVVIDNATGWPVPGAEVYALPTDTDKHGPEVGGFLDADGKTNERGEFKFTNMAARPYSLNVREGNLASSAAIIVTGGQQKPVTLRVKFAQWSRLKPRKPEPAR